MAILTNSERDEISSRLSRWAKDTTTAIDYDRRHINAAAQVVEDTWETNKASLSAAVDTATQAITPSYTFTNAQKKQIMRWWLLQKFGREA